MWREWPSLGAAFWWRGPVLIRGLTVGVWVGQMRRWIRTEVSDGARGGAFRQAVDIHSEG